MVFYANLSIFYIGLPLLLVVSSIFRPCVISGIYLLFFFILPFIPVPTNETINKSSGIYLKILLATSVLTTLSQIVFQIVLIALPPYGEMLKNCEFLEQMLRHVGFIRFNGIRPISAITWLSPEIIMLIGSVCVYVACKKLSTENNEVEHAALVPKVKPKRQLLRVTVAVGKYIVLSGLCFAAVLRPSIPGGVYFLIFLGATTWWACKSLDRKFGYFLRFLTFFIFAHIVILYAYQMQWPQTFLEKDDKYARYFGLTQLINVNCTEPRDFLWSGSEEWASFLNPIMLLWLYYFVVIESSLLLTVETQKKQGTFSRLESNINGPLSRQMSQRLSGRRLARSRTMRRRWQSATRKVRVLRDKSVKTGESTPLISGTSPSTRYGSGSKKPVTILQDSTGSVVVAETYDDIPMEPLGKDDESADEKPSLFDNIIYGIESVVTMAIKSSYIFTNIIMMAWSITFHSWLTFVLLLLANIMWMIPNQRRAMLRFSPFLVTFAWFLLISSYIFSMNLTDEELPQVVGNVDLGLIGFKKVTELPCRFLLIKCLYTCMFWITLKQYSNERKETKQSSALADMVAPLQVTIDTATGVPQEESKTSKTLESIGNFLMDFLTKFWIWIVAITLFSVAITGERMTIFRIIYMALFIFFVLTFQLSYAAWRKLLFPFWVTVILYSMTMLILVYTYQFENIREYWSTYLHVSPQQQLDIGLEAYAPKQLFIRLVTPTFFIIITAIQINCFQKNYHQLSEPKIVEVQEPLSDTTSVLDEDASKLTKEKQDLELSQKHSITEIGSISNVEIQHKILVWWNSFQNFVNICFLFLEIHFLMITILICILMCIYDHCAIYFPFIVLIVISLFMGRKVMLGVIYTCSIIASIVLLLRMLYQIDIVSQDMWNTNCERINKTLNNAVWLGFTKATADKPLHSLVAWNIGFIVAVTLMSVIYVRQISFSGRLSTQTRRLFYVFPEISRIDADKDLRSCVKYLINFGFYKFGVEICLIVLVGLIGYRFDLYGLIYAIWLFVLVMVKRSSLSKIWNIFFVFLGLSIMLQYLMMTGLPPYYCDTIVLEWDVNASLFNVQRLMFLLSYDRELPVGNLFYDFVLLLLVSRQSVVFHIESSNGDEPFQGGSNECIEEQGEDPNFINPVPDFVTYCRSYLDVVKRAVFLNLIWFTLAAMFLAGTQRVSIFSAGYLIGAFVFLWQGSDIYLRPIPKMMRSWKRLLYYNVLIILCKSFLQVVGCVFVETLSQHACWLINLFNIGCSTASKLSDTSSQDECKVNEYIGLAWDGICFASLIIQCRIFQSYYFLHVINETKATTILASRGADLIEEIRRKRISDRTEGEKQILEKIKIKMEHIKAGQQKLHGQAYETNNHFIAQPPLAHSTSTSSCGSQQTPPAGYHTPIDEEDDEEPAPLTPRASSLVHTQVPSPFSAIMTGSLEGYLEPQRISFSSPPNSELNPRPPSPDDSFPVFSPPPYEAAPPYTEAVTEQPSGHVRRQSSIGPPWLAGCLITPRQSVISYSSRSPLSHHTYGIFPGRPRHRIITPNSHAMAIRSGEYYMFDEIDDDQLDLIEETKNISIEDEEDERKVLGPKLGVGDLLSTAIKTDITTAIKSEIDIQRRSSMPLSRQRSSYSDRTQLSVPHSAPPTTRVVVIDPKESGTPEPKPGTSKDDYDDLSDITDLPESTVWERIINYLYFVWLIFESCCLTMTLFLNKYSRDYRYVLKELNQEKKFLKENTRYYVGLRLGKAQIWRPAGSFQTLVQDAGIQETKRSNDSSDDKPTVSEEESDTNAQATSSMAHSSQLDRQRENNLTIPEIRILAPSLERGLDSPFLGSQDHVKSFETYEDGEMSVVDQPPVAKLLLSIWHVVLSHSHILCYFMIFLNQIKSATFLSLPLPMFVLLWGTLTLPRPMKTFWVTIIAYIEVIVFIKCMFQFDIIYWNRNQNISPLFPPRIIGIEKKTNYALWDLLVLLMVFFHRFLMKSLGLWKSTFVPAVTISDDEYVVSKNTLEALQADASKIASSDFSKNGQLEELNEETNDSTELVNIKATEVSAFTNFVSTIKMRTVRYAACIKEFFNQILDPSSRIPTDVYSYMFLCDFFNFFVILIGYSSFGPYTGGEGVSDYLQENRVPPLFLMMLIVQFLLIIIDRAIFLRKNIFAKIIFQFLQIIFLHIWLFIIYPLITDRAFNSVLAPQIYYMVKCFYFLLSAYQIRSGYPTRVLGNFICRGYNYFNLFLYKGFLAIPFLFELRTVMDWMWTDTSMTVFEWIKMEDIFSHIFQIKCVRYCEKEYPQPRGEKKPTLVKYFMGGAALIAMIAIIWFPLVFFALIDAVGIPNAPFGVTLELRVGPFAPIYQMSVQSNSIYGFNDMNYDKINAVYAEDRNALTFLANYQASDIVAIKFSDNSASVWGISPPDRKRMVAELNSTDPLTIILRYTILHKSNTKEDSGSIEESVSVTLNSSGNDINPIRQKILDMLIGDETSPPAIINHIIPKFIKITNKGTAKPVSQLMKEDKSPLDKTFRDLEIKKLSSSNGQGEKTSEWWSIQEICTDNNYKKLLAELPYADCQSVVMYGFSEKLFPSTLNFITGAGIIGVYTTIVLVAGRLLRSALSGSTFKIMFEDLPFVDRIYQLCFDIYLVRESREFVLEEDLFAKLIFLFRSPETLIKWTRPKEENDEGGDNDDHDDSSGK